MLAVNNHAPIAAPDEPDHPGRCESCNGFLPRNWEYEDIPEERITVWYWTCKRCGEIARDEQ